MSLNQRNKQLVWKLWNDLEHAQLDAMDGIVATAMAENVVWYGFDPLPQLTGRAAFINEFWKPLVHSFPDLSRETHIFMARKSNGRVDGDMSKDGKMWVSGTGYFHGTFENDYLKIPASGEKVRIR